MAWDNSTPDGTKSVKINTPKMLANTAYTKTTLNVDHVWDTDANLDGRHQFIQSAKQQSGGIPFDPLLGASMDAVSYFKEKLAAEASAQQDVQPFFRNATDIMQLLGIRVCAVFNPDTSLGITVAQPILYSHNLTEIVRTAKGRYTVTFPALPSANYLAVGGCVANESGVSNVLNPQGSTDLSTKTTTEFRFETRKMTGGSTTGDDKDPKQCWFVLFGG